MYQSTHAFKTNHLEDPSMDIGPHNLYGTSYPEPPVLPPAGHPRVYFTPKDIPVILENAEKAQNAKAWAQHLRNLATEMDGKLPPLKEGQQTNVDSPILAVIETNAFDYAVHGNRPAGKAAIGAMRNYADSVVFVYDYDNIGQTLFTIAAVYDWCYDLLSEEDKTFFQVSAIEMAKELEIGWPPVDQGAVTGHGPEGQLFRDLMCIGIAMYDERPDIYRIVAGRFFDEYIEPKLFMFPSHMHHQGSHYTAYRVQWEILATWIFDRMGHPNVFGPDQQYCLYYTLYSRRPDGQVLRDGDTHRNNVPYNIYDSYYYRSMIHMGNYFNDPYLKWEGLREMPFLLHETPRRNQTLNSAEVLIFNNPELGGRPTSEFPLSKYFPSPKGAMIARTGWSDGFESPDVVAEMKINEWWFANHQHLDAGSFQLYYKGALANDTGYYQGFVKSGSNKENNGNSGYGSQHDMNYNKRTIAHNCMLVYDPDEKLQYRKFGHANDGGQRVPRNGREVLTHQEMMDPENQMRTGEVLGHEFGPDPMVPNYTYLKGDLTAAYSDKITAYERSFMFLNLKDADHPAALIVFDRVVTSNENNKKTWLLHGLNEPEISGSQTVFKDTRPGYNGKLTVDTLLPDPDNISIVSVGGPEKEFLVEGVNYYAETFPGGANEGGGYRMELSPKTPSKLDYFLNVLQVGEAQPDMPPLSVTRIDTQKFVGVRIGDRVVLFAKDRDRTREKVEFSFSGEGLFEITVCDICEGTWQVERNGTALHRASVTKGGGVLDYTGSAGAYCLSYLSAEVQLSEAEGITPTHEGIGIRVGGTFVYTQPMPAIRNAVVLAPAQDVLKYLGVTVQMDDWEGSASLVKGNKSVHITIGDQTAYVDGKTIDMGAMPFIADGKLMVPIRFAAEAFGARTLWDEIAKIISIIKKL